VTIDITGDVTQ